MADFHIRKGDLLPAIESPLYRDYGSPVGVKAADLTGAIGATLVYRPKSGAWITKTGEFVGALTGGRVKYAWAAGDTNTAGVYEGYWRITYASGETESFPNNSFFTMAITESA